MTISRAAGRGSPLVLLLIVLASACLVSCGASQAPTSESSAPATAVVHIKNFGYQPDTVTVRVGGRVTWINEDNVDHTTTANSGAWDSGTLTQGAHFVHRFAKAGTYPYHCSFHAFMTGTVRVVG